MLLLADKNKESRDNNILKSMGRVHNATGYWKVANYVAKN